MKKFLHMSLMGAFLVAVDAPVMASPENPHSHNGHPFFLALPREMREEHWKKSEH